MSAGRIYALDYIRVIAVAMILTCHYLLFSGVSSGLGRYLAGIGNMIFFLLSALLYGNKYNSSNNSVIEKTPFETIRFVKGRIIKIGSSLFPFLIIMALLFIAFDVDFSWVDVGLNFAFLGYFGKLPGLGHLWFITVLFACYVEMVMLIKIKPNNPYFAWAFLAAMIFLMFLGERLRVTVGAFVHMGFFGLVFLKSQWLYEKSQRIRLWHTLVIILFNMACILLELNGMFEKSQGCHVLLTDFCGLFLLTLFLRYLPNRPNKLVAFFSGIGLEIYLIHHTLCAGPIIRVTSWPYNHLVNFSAMVIMSVLLAIVLHYISMWLNKLLSTKAI